MKTEEYKKDIIAKKLIKLGGLELPSYDFSDNLMTIIRNEAKLSLHKVEPIFSKKVWYMIASAVAFIMLFTIINLPQGEASKPGTLYLKNNIMPYLNYFFDSIPKFVSSIHFSPMIPLLLISILLIEILDFTFRKLIKNPKKI